MSKNVVIVLAAVVVIGLALGAAAMLLPGMLYLTSRGERILYEQFVELDGPDVIVSLELEDAAGTVLWALQNPEGRTLERVEYGTVPEGFIQQVPSSGDPRVLARDEELVLTYILSGGRFARIRMRPVGHDSFYHQLTISGEGCETPDCIDGLLRDPLPMIPPLPPGRPAAPGGSERTP